MRVGKSKDGKKFGRKRGRRNTMEGVHWLEGVSIGW